MEKKYYDDYSIGKCLKEVKKCSGQIFIDSLPLYEIDNETVNYLCEVKDLVNLSDNLLYSFSNFINHLEKASYANNIIDDDEEEHFACMISRLKEEINSEMIRRAYNYELEHAEDEAHVPTYFSVGNFLNIYRGYLNINGINFDELALLTNRDIKNLLSTDNICEIDDKYFYRVLYVLNLEKGLSPNSPVIFYENLLIDIFSNELDKRFEKEFLFRSSTYTQIKFKRTEEDIPYKNIKDLAFGKLFSFYRTNIPKNNSFDSILMLISDEEMKAIENVTVVEEIDDDTLYRLSYYLNVDKMVLDRSYAGYAEALLKKEVNDSIKERVYESYHLDDMGEREL